MDERRAGGGAGPGPDADAPEAYRAAVRDPVTGMYVRPYFDETLRRDFAFAARHGRLLSVVLMEIDGLPDVRGTWGPKAAEAVLRTVSARVREVLRAEDVIATLDEGTFALLLRDVDAGTAAIVGERLRRTVSTAPRAFDGFEVRATVSVGAATMHMDGSARPADLVAEADANLRRARDAGGDRVVPGL